MSARRLAVALLATLGIAESASASFLDTDFWCRTYGCAVVWDGQTYDIYDNWQFGSNTCCVPVGGQMVSYYTRAGTALVTGTFDRVAPAPGDHQSGMVEIVDGEVVNASVIDDGDGYLDAGDTLGAFSLNSDTSLRLKDTAYSHSIFVTSRDTRFSVRALAQIREASGDFADTVQLGDIKLTPSMTSSGTNAGVGFGNRANTSNSMIVSGVDDLGDLAGNPTQIFEFNRQPGIRVGDGDIEEQVIRLDFLYELPDYDMSMGAGSLGVDVVFNFYREN